MKLGTYVPELLFLAVFFQLLLPQLFVLGVLLVGQLLLLLPGYFPLPLADLLFSAPCFLFFPTTTLFLQAPIFGQLALPLGLDALALGTLLLVPEALAVAEFWKLLLRDDALVTRANGTCKESILRVVVDCISFILILKG